MALSKKRIVAGGETDYPWEREAIDFVLEQLPDSNPHMAWPLHELLDPTTGRLYEIDLMVLARSGLFLVEIKSHPGVLTGDHQDWTFTEPGRHPRHLACPYPTTNHKAKVLGSLLDLKTPHGQARPYVHPLVFVAHEHADIRLTGGQPSYVVTRKDIRQVLVHGLLNARGRVVNRPMMRQLRDTMRALGLQPSKASRRVAGFELKQLVDEGEGYQEHHAVGVDVATDRARVRSYLVPRATSTDRQKQLERAAWREADVLSRLGHHPNILSYRSYQPKGPLGPAVVFEAFEDGLPLHIFLKQHPDLPFDERLGILEAVVQAIDHCHRADFLHRNLSPASVLVRRGEKGLEVRLHRFQTAAASTHTSLGTQHVQQLAEDLDRLYQAPEVLRDPRKAQTTADVFSIGCLTWLLFTGQPPATTLAEREKLIAENEGLRISTVKGELANIDEVLAWATEPGDIHRPDNALEWFESGLLDKLTQPEPSADEGQDPYEAEKGAKLGEGLVVLRVLGSGATAKVLKVRRGEQDFALKVPHDEGCALRLAQEGEVLGRLKHPHIIQLHERLELGGRLCLLIGFAGDRSFNDTLRAEGTLSLDKARRYGADLMAAVRYLEDQGITHRDIKPGNLGFTTQAKKARHLTLFDFSLAASDARSITTGTPDWRDPWLHVRGQWDAAADRYAVAAVLYRMLAGTRPEYIESRERSAHVAVEPERFDPALRDRLKGFFERCFAPDAGDRFGNAEQMLLAWEAVFTDVTEHEEPESEHDLDTAVAMVRADTLVEGLPLSARARNALDRAGVVTVADLLQLPQNHLSAIRGVGHKVAKEIVQLANLLRAHHSVTSKPGLLPDYAGPRIGLDSEDLALPKGLLLRLQDAGITSTHDLAQHPAEITTRIVGRDGAETARQALVLLAEAFPQAGTLSQWAHSLLAPQTKNKSAAERRIRVLVGLDSLPNKVEDTAELGTRSVAQVAEAFGIGPALVHSSMQNMRQRWQAGAGREELEAAVGQVLSTLGPVCTLRDAATELARLHGTEGSDDPRQLELAASMVRLAAELRPAPIHWRRLGEQAWVGRDDAVLDALAALADEADALAVMDPLASNESVRNRLVAKVAGTPLVVLPPDRLVNLAARASRQAAASARMEIYPRGMQAARALKLSLNVLTPPGLTPDVVRQRVHGRYPDAEALPERLAALDRLLEPHGLRLDPQSGEYLRPGLAHLTTGTIIAPTRMTSALPHQRRRQSPQALEAQAFQDALDLGVESGRFRVVQVRADFAERAATLLAESLGVEPISLDHRIWEAMQAKAGELGVDPANIVAADRDGSEGEHWPLLKQLVELAAQQEIRAILADRDETALLVHPGVLARFELSAALFELSQRAQNEEGAAVVLLVPSHADGLAPSINRRLPVPTVAGSQRLRMPESWFRNAHRAPAVRGEA